MRVRRLDENFKYIMATLGSTYYVLVALTPGSGFRSKLAKDIRAPIGLAIVITTPFFVASVVKDVIFSKGHGRAQRRLNDVNIA
jgi:hypothetical protein